MSDIENIVSGLQKEFATACASDDRNDLIVDTEKIEIEFKRITKTVKYLLEKHTDKPTEVSELFIELRSLITALDNQHIQISKIPTKTEDLIWLRRRIADLHSDIVDLRSMKFGLIAGSLDNARAQFASAGQWAIHFSTVRMTIATFFVGLSWGVISLKWDDFSDALLLASLGIWLLAGYFLMFFTRATERETKKQKILKALIPTIGEPPNNGVLTKKMKWTLWKPVVAYAILTVFFLCLLAAWRCHPKKPCRTCHLTPTPRGHDFNGERFS